MIWIHPFFLYQISGSVRQNPRLSGTGSCQYQHRLSLIHILRKCDVGSGLLHGDSGNCMDKGKYDGTDFAVGHSWYDAASVSYTHLDVYKRQTNSLQLEEVPRYADAMMLQRYTAVFGHLAYLSLIHI